MPKVFLRTILVAIATISSLSLNAASSTVPFPEIESSQATRLPFTKTVFNFSDPTRSTIDVSVCIADLIRAENSGSLDPLNVAYKTSEIIAGIARSNPSICPAFAHYVQNPDALYNSWSAVYSRVTTAAVTISSFSDIDACNDFVATISRNYMPGILAKLGADATQSALAQEALVILQPTVGLALYVGYQGAHIAAEKAAEVGAAIYNAIDGQAVARCGCVGSKSSRKLTKAANSARSIAAGHSLTTA